MEHLNYHHLRVFWTAAREGGVTRASEKLHVSQPTVTTQIRALEQALGQKLFTRSGRRLVLTDSGRSAYRYADEIVGLGQELMDTMKGGSPGREVRLTVGVADVVPKLIAYRILEPGLRLPEPVRIEAIEDAPERLLAELAVFGLDVVIADAPVGPAVRVRAYDHLLGECAVSVFGADASGQGLPARLPAFAGRRSLPASQAALGSAPRARRLVRARGSAPAHRRGVRRQRPDEGARTSGARPVPRAFTHRRARCVASTASARWEGSSPSARGSTPSRSIASSSTRR